MRPDRRTSARVGLAGTATLLLLAGAAPARAVVHTVRPGGLLQVTARGFAPSAPVDVRTVGLISATEIRANAGGVVHLAYRVPDRTGSYTLLLAGPVAGTSSSTDPAPANLRVTVPLVVRVPYRVAGPGSGVDGVGRHVPGSPSAGVGGQAAGPADTGTDVVSLLVLGAALIGAGGLVAAASRQRRGGGSVRLFRRGGRA